MDLAKKTEPNFPVTDLILRLATLAHLAFIFYLASRQVNSSAAALSEFKAIRDLLYAGYTVFIVIFSLMGFAGNTQKEKNKSGVKFIPQLVLLIVLTTFSYAIAKLIAEIYSFLIQLKPI